MSVLYQSAFRRLEALVNPPLKAQRLAHRLADLAPAYYARKLKNPFFIIGCGRSGTTLLVDTLAAHPEIASYPDEANELWHPQTFPWRYSRHKATVPPLEVDSKSFSEFSLQYRTDVEVERLRAVFGAYQWLMRGPVFLNKSAMITFMIPFILREFPEAKFVHMYRDGRAVALSWAKRLQKMIDEDPQAVQAYQSHQYEMNFDVFLRMTAKSWQDHMDEIERRKAELALVESGKWFEMNYEGFTARPVDYLSQLANFMSISRDFFAQNDYDYITSRNFKFRSELEERHRGMLEQIMRPALLAKGYIG